MSDFSLIDIVTLIRQEIRKEQIGSVKKITGPKGDKGDKGEPGGPGIQGPRGDRGDRGAAGPKGDNGKKGDKGAKGEDGTDGVSITRVEQDIDGAVVVHMSDGEHYVIELPLIQGQAPTEVHYKVGGGSGSGGDSGGGVVDLSGYVRRPNSTLQDQWLAYREGSDGSRTWKEITTDLIVVNPSTFRNSKGQFIGTPEDLENIKNQRDVNEFLYKAIESIEQGEVNLDGYATEEYVDSAIDAIDLPEIDTSDLVSKTGGDEMEGPLVIQAQGSDGRATNKIQTLGVYSNSEGSALRLGTTGDKVYIGNDATEFNGPIKVNEIQEKTADKGVLLANQTSLAEEGTDPNHLVTKGYVDSADRQLQSEIEQIALGLETLLTQRTHGQWKYIGFSGDNIPRNPGEFALISDDLSAAENLLTINLTDLNGTVIGLSDVEVGDYIEIVDLDEPANYALFTCTKEPEGTGISNVELALKDKGQNFLVGETCEIRFFAVNEENINLSELDERYVKVTGDTMTGALETPDLIVKDVTPNTEASVLIEGWVDGTNPAARILMSNKKYNNAYGSIQFKGNNADGWFQINKDLDVAGKGVHSVTRIRFSGEKAIQDGNTNRILLNGKVTIPKAGDNNVDGFTVKGKTDAGLYANLLYVYHNASGLDVVNYAGKQSAGSENIATCKYVDDKIGAIPTPTSAGALVSTSFGCKYYRSSNSNSFTFYTQDSNSALNSAHSSTKFINIKLPSDFWMVKAGVVPAGTDMGYITITNIGDGKVLFSGQVISVSSGGTTFKADAKKDLWSSGSYTEGNNYLIRMESCFREA